MNRHWICRLLLLAGLLVPALGCERSEQRPSIVLVVVDTLRADRLAAYGPTTTEMPQMDRWVERGRVFDNTFASSSWTLPSFGSIYTGLYPIHHGAGFKFRGKGRYSRLDPTVGTLAESLQQAGYRTAAVITNIYLSPSFGLARGFEELFDLSTGANDESATAETVVDTALGWLETSASDPLFLVVHLFDTHLPYDPPESVWPDAIRNYEGPFELPIYQSSGLRRDRLPLDEADRDFIRAAYDGEARWVDRHLDRLFEQLERDGMLDHGLVLLTSDHGEELWDHGGFEHGHTLYQELLGVPLVIWGRDIEPGRAARPASLVDLLPTVLALAGVELPDDLDGVPLMGGDPAGEERDLQAHWNIHGRQQWALIRWPIKVIRPQSGTDFEVFDLARDPRESSRLGNGEADLVPVLWRELKQLSRTEPPGESEAVDLDSITTDRLRALGYID